MPSYQYMSQNYIKKKISITKESFPYIKRNKPCQANQQNLETGAHKLLLCAKLAKRKTMGTFNNKYML